MNLTRWHKLLDQIDLTPESTTFQALVDAYAEPHRHYHNTQHIADCLQQFDGFFDLAESPAEVELALWFHDAIYEIGSSNNERDSARWAQDFLSAAEAEPERCQRVYDYIMATCHTEQVQTLAGDAALVVDIDLSILGRDEATYGQFERNIRQEYRRVPKMIYCHKRRQLLQGFLDRPAIYSLEPVRERYEDAARENLQAAILALH